MNRFVADPHWGWWIIFYFFLGGIAAGAYFISSLMVLLGNDADRRLARLGFGIALPLIAICGLFLILDLDRPERFWHMLLQSEVVHQALREGWPATGQSWRTMAQAPALKYWSPMSIGSWALAAFGFFSVLSILVSTWPCTTITARLRTGSVGRVTLVILRWLVHVPGCLVGFFVAAYTGALLTATNQPLWSDSVWIAALFLTSAASTGIAAMILLTRVVRAPAADALHRLERADVWALSLELAVFAAFVASLGAYLVPVWHTPSGKLLIAGTLLVGLLAPLAIHLRLAGGNRRAAWTAAVFALLGGFLLRYAIVTTPAQLLAQG